MNKPSKRQPGRPKTSDTSQNVKEQILALSSRLFMEHGYEKVSLDAIADACGVTKASVYYYFHNKAELFTASIVMLMGNVRHQTKLILDRPGSLPERLREVVRAYLQVRHSDFESMLREVRPHVTDEQMAAMRQAEGGIHELMAETFRDAMSKGEIGEANPLFLSHAFSALLMIGGRELETSPFSSREEAADAIVAFFCSGTHARDLME
ncbi:TetR/AcrR family transcriptional regulator [Gorillibacterium timonense]|uniref:TetR/AcrR family transcriptional regulator n=1 Tax=Gorillibacterium timonense TaxID=1689269 RepID=UPI00071C4888|nr:TetR/AcrR family transcriptional regulator [Gorillibacterium timonense]